MDMRKQWEVELLMKNQVLEIVDILGVMEAGIMEILNHIKFKNHNMQHQHQIYLVQEIIMKKQVKTQDMGLEQQKVS